MCSFRNITLYIVYVETALGLQRSHAYEAFHKHYTVSYYYFH